MNKPLMATLLAALLFGCATSSVQTLPAPLENVSVIVSSQGNLREAVVQAAVRRRWSPTELGPDTIRCTLVQRDHRVVIDVKILDAKHYSMISVENNIPEPKFLQWRNNLQREIAKYAAQGSR